MVQQENMDIESLYKKDTDDTGDWLEKQVTPRGELPGTAQDLLKEEYFAGDMELAERRLTDWIEKSKGNVNNLKEEDRIGCRRQSLIFLVLYQGTKAGGKYHYSGINNDPVVVNNLLKFARNTILETPELEKELPRRGLEEFFTDSQAA